ncbi:FCD domain-containing protein [Frankia sp. AiPs1]|uniref:FadR/GntR family transcriptional regulator n=1 Tax=Frankia sp. AiPs1 TaxID=573493 RepID=UPI002044AB43|nr:FCD domain-containing protein [Frankia sp. AiPs1]MCM3920337.1 FCD domain-containing protein [Frankia sp. AiPs1]
MPSTDRLVESARGPAISVRHPPRGDARGKLAAQVAWRIEDDIVRAGWPVGAVIGSEPTLIERYKVSRAVFREAVRIVEHHQVATMRRGPSGGLIVRAPDEVAVTTALGVYLEYVGVSIESILRARFIIESLAATLAPARITEDGIRDLRKIIARQETADPTEFGAHHQLHHAIAAATGNPVLVLFVDVLNSLTFRYAAHQYATTRNSASPARRTQGTEEVHRNHAAIAEAVIGGDAARAQHLAAVHLEAMYEWMTAPTDDDAPAPAPGTDSDSDSDSAGSAGGRRIRPRESGLGPVPGPGPVGTMPAGKLAETVAGRIRDDVARDGVAVGVVIGSESELLARYGVSRAVLREAVRLLEYHSVAQMRRGPGGGLVVTEPDPAATVEATALYLEYSQAGVDDLRIVRDALELSCVDILIERRGPELTARLEELLAADAGEAPGGPADAGHHLHMELARLTGNEALASFVRVLTAIWRRHVDGSRPAPPVGKDESAAGGCGQAVCDARTAHRAIIDAINAGDRGLARHRMRRHLEALSDWSR